MKNNMHTDNFDKSVAYTAGDVINNIRIARVKKEAWRKGFLMGQIVSCIIWIAVLFLVAKVGAVTMSATVEESEMRKCIESCGYQFK